MSKGAQSWRRRLYLMLALILIVPFIVHGAGEEESAGAAAAEPKMVRLVATLWGDEPVDEKRVQDAINERLKADRLNLYYERTWIPFGGGTTWEQKTNLMLSAGEEFELLSVLQDRWPVSQYVGQGAAHAIDEHLDEYGPAIMEGIPENLWKDVTINGKIYALPAYFAPMTSNIERISIRKDLYDKHGLDIPRTREDLIRASEIIHANEPDLKPRAWTKLGHDPSVFLHRGYDTYPFTVQDELIYIDQDGNVKAWIETEEFKQDSAFWRELYVKGLVHPDLLSGGADLHHRELNKEAFTFEHSIWHPTSIQGNEPEGEYMTILLYPDEVKFNSFGMRNGTLVPITAKHPEAGIQFVNWVYSSQENHDLLALGIEGVHWRESDTVLTWNNPYAAGSKTSWQSPAVEKIVDPETNQALYNHWIFLIGQLRWMRISPLSHPSQLEERDPAYTNVEDSITIGFAFDSSPVATEYANLKAMIAENVWPMRFGVVDYDEAYDRALKNMKAAGLDRVIEEYQKQFSAYLASN